MIGAPITDPVFILFFSNNHVFWAQEIFTEQGLGHRVVPVPRHLSSECGYAVQVAASDRERAAALLTTEDIEIDRIEGAEPRPRG